MRKKGESRKIVISMQLPRKIIKLRKTCFAAPSQWEGVDSEEYPIYIRYRWGKLSVRIGKKRGDVWSAVDGDEIFSKEKEVGWIMFPELEDWVQGVLDFSDLDDIETHRGEVDPMLKMILGELVKKTAN